MLVGVSMSIREEEYSLKREIGWYGSFCMGYADVGADIYVAIGLIAAYAAGASPLAFALASVAYICTGLTYAELTSTYPYAGGAHVYAMKAFNDLVGFVAGWTVMLSYIADIALFSVATSGYLSFFLPRLSAEAFVFTFGGTVVSLPSVGIIAFLFVLILLALNITGIRESSRFNEILVSLSLVIPSLILALGFLFAFRVDRFLSQITMLGADLVLPDVPYLLSGVEFQHQNFLFAVTLAMSSFIGIESIAQAAEETKRPYRWIPRANGLSIISVIVFALGLSALSVGMLSWSDLAYAKMNPMARLAEAIPFIGVYLAPLVALTGLAICFVSTNTGVIGVSRVVFSMARFQLLPKWFYKVHPKTRTPHRTILAFGLIGGVLALSGELRFLAGLYTLIALFSYIIVNMSLIVLRNVEPETYRPWTVGGEVRVRMFKRVWRVPYVGLAGSFVCAVMWLLTVAYHPESRIIGALWLLVGLLTFFLYRKSIRVPVLSKAMGQSIVPGGYLVDALVLVRSPEDEESVVEALKNLDKRFKLTLLNIINPKELGLSMDTFRDYEEVKKLEDVSFSELSGIARRLRAEKYECKVKVRVGPLEELVKAEAESPDNDVIVLIKRRTLRSQIEKEREDSVHAAVSKYARKLMVIRRGE